MTTTAPLRATPFGGFWHTQAGQAAHSYLEAWGAVERERRLSGDPSAVPKPTNFGEGRESRSTGRGSPSDPPDILLKHADVDRLISRHSLLKTVLLHIYCYGATTVEHEDGTESIRYDSLRLEYCDLPDSFDSHLRLMGISAPAFLMWAVGKFGQKMIRELGL